MAEKVRRRFCVVEVASRAMAPKASRVTAIAMSLPGRSHGVGRSIFAVLLLDVVMLTGTTPPLTRRVSARTQATGGRGFSVSLWMLTKPASRSRS